MRRTIVSIALFGACASPPAQPVAPAPSASAAPTASAGPAEPLACAEAQAVLDAAGSKEPVPRDLEQKLAACGDAACRFREALRFVEAKRYDRGVHELARVAHDGSDELAEQAQMVVIAFAPKLLQTTPWPAACGRWFEGEIAFMKGRFCSKPSAKMREPCDGADKMTRDLVRARAEDWVRRADRGKAADGYRRGAETYMELFEQSCGARVPASRIEPCAEIAYDAMVAYRAAGDAEGRERAKKLLVDPKHGLHETVLAKKAAQMP